MITTILRNQATMIIHILEQKSITHNLNSPLSIQNMIPITILIKLIMLIGRETKGIMTILMIILTTIYFQIPAHE